jgi:hypothetical protein
VGYADAAITANLTARAISPPAPPTPGSASRTRATHQGMALLGIRTPERL